MANKDSKEKKNETLRGEIKERVVGYIVGAFGLVAGLAWNDAIKAFIEYYFPIQSGGTLVPKLVYAIAITVVVVVISTYLVKIAKVEEEK